MSKAFSKESMKQFKIHIQLCTVVMGLKSKMRGWGVGMSQQTSEGKEEVRRWCTSQNRSINSKPLTREKAEEQTGTIKEEEDGKTKRNQEDKERQKNRKELKGQIDTTVLDAEVKAATSSTSETQKISTLSLFTGGC